MVIFTLLCLHSIWALHFFRVKTERGSLLMTLSRFKGIYKSISRAVRSSLISSCFSEKICMQWVPLFVPIKCIPTYLIFFNDSKSKHYRGHGTSNKAICCARHRIWISNHWHVGICIVPPFKDLIPRNKCNIMRSAIQSKNRILTLSWQFW